MQVNTCIRDMVSARGLKLVDLSRKLGRADSWARTVSRPERSPALSTVVEIAQSLGYSVAIVDSETGERLGTIGQEIEDKSKDQDA